MRTRDLLRFFGRLEVSLCLAVLGLAIAYVWCSGWGRSAFVHAGLALQTLGILTVVVGIREVVKEFGWPRALRLPRQQTLSPPLSRNEQKFFSPRVEQSVEASTIEERLGRVEGALPSIEKRIEVGLQGMQERISDLEEKIWREVKQTKKRLFNFAVEGLPLSATGAAWILVGVWASAAPELLSLPK